MVVGEKSQPAFSERLGPGRYSYRVVAVRASATSPGRASPPSDTVAAAVVASDPATSAGAPGGAGAANARGSGTSIAKKPFVVGGRRIAQFGLPTGAALPGRIGLPDLPSAGTPMEWGTFTKNLPYEVGTPDAKFVAGPTNVAARSPARIIPPDGLRWVAAGALLVVIASFLRLLSSRLPTPTEQDCGK